MKSIALKTIIVLVSSLLFATQASAYEITTPVDPTGKTWEPSGRWTTTFYAGGTYRTETRDGQAVFIRKLPLGSTADGYYILNSVSLGNIPFEYGKYYSVNLSFQMQNQKSLDMQSMPALNRITMPEGSPYRLMSVTSDWAPCANYHKFTANTGVENDDFSNYDGMCNYGGIVYNIIVQATDTRTASFQLGMTNTDMFRWYMTASSAAITNNNQGTIFASTIMEFRKVEQGEALKAQQNEINSGNQAQSDGNTAGNQAQSDASTAGTSLISGASSIIGALTDTAAGTCNVNMNMGILDLGTQNFCQGDIGPIRPIIATITNVLFAFVSLRVFIFLIGVMFGLFDQFLGTKTETGGTNG